MVMSEGRNPGTAQLKKLGEKFQVAKPLAIIEEVRESVSNWKEFAKEAGVSKESTTIVNKTLSSIQ